MTVSSSSADSIRNARAAALPAKLSRSWLLVNAAMPDRFESAQMSEADSVIFDLEAPVPEDGKDDARDNVVRALSDGMSGWVRVNSITSDHWSADLEAIKGLPGLRGVMLPNTELPEQVTYTSMRVSAGVPVLALIETALGIENATRIAEAPGTFRLALGTNDFRKDTGVADDPIALAYARSRLVVATRVGGLPGAIDGPSTVGAPRERVVQDCEWTMKMGMAGKLVLDTDQIGTVNIALSPSSEDRKWAREMLQQAEGGMTISDGSYLPRLSRAKKIAQLADSYGLWNA
ncbi:CoA ester lyase [Brevibacterium daeguense]|uniref:CoA ester lyase n=1 Tax=Brevibacterium daeguense TaxID=909936 RepID=A0ABP8ELS3_9MICO|nr:CoA ester lyase [Brevibacterium daeguense]